MEGAGALLVEELVRHRPRLELRRLVESTVGAHRREPARDAVLRDAERAILTLNTLDYRKVQDGLTLWEQSATGSLLEQLRANRDTYARAITDSTTFSSAKVLDAAVASLDARAGTAQVLAGVDVTSQMDQGDPGCAHRRVRMDMIWVGDGWKVSALTPVGDTYTEVGPCPPPASPN